MGKKKILIKRTRRVGIPEEIEKIPKEEILQVGYQKKQEGHLGPLKDQQYIPASKFGNKPEYLICRNYGQERK